MSTVKHFPRLYIQREQAVFRQKILCEIFDPLIGLLQVIFIRYDTIAEFNVDSKAEYSALSSTRSQKKKLKQTTPVPL